MARRISNPKIDTRSARARLPARREPVWAVISAGCALGYRKGAKGGTWIARFRDEEGRQHYQSLGAADDARDPDGRTVFAFDQAQKMARDWFEAKAREDAGETAADPAEPYTVARAFEDYLADYQRRGGKAVSRMKSSARAWILPDLGSIPLNKLTMPRLRAWHEDIAEKPPQVRVKVTAQETRKYREVDASPEGVRRRRSTARRVLNILKATLNHAFREGKCVSDAAWRPVRPFREADASRMRYLSDDEARRLANACPPDFRALVAGALLTGCRYGELRAMTIADFNGDAGTVQVRISKSGKPRHVVLADEGRGFFAALAAGRAGGERLLLRANGRPWGNSDQQRPFVAACKAARIDPPISFHGLRHTYASRLAMRGVPLPVIAAQLGHSDTRMVEKHYGHLAPSYVADTIRAAFGDLGVAPASNVAPIVGATLL